MRFAPLLLLAISGVALAQYYDPNPVYDYPVIGAQPIGVDPDEFFRSLGTSLLQVQHMPADQGQAYMDRYHCFYGQTLVNQSLKKEARSPSAMTDSYLHNLARIVEQDCGGAAAILPEGAFPPLHDSPEMLCEADVHCTTKQLQNIFADYRKRWDVTPDLVRRLCGHNLTVPDLFGCELAMSLILSRDNPEEAKHKEPWLP